MLSLLFYSKVSSKHIYKMPTPTVYPITKLMVSRHVIPTENSGNSAEVLSKGSTGLLCAALCT